MFIRNPIIPLSQQGTVQPSGSAMTFWPATLPPDPIFDAIASRVMAAAADRMDKEWSDMSEKPSGVAAAQATAADIGIALNTVEGFEHKKLPQWEVIGNYTDGTPIYRNNWGRYDPWIPNSVRMPPLGEWVLCYSKHRGCETARVEKHWYGWVTKDKKNLVPDAYTHWMPMPPTPGTTP